jgi:hypothetical protein
MLPLDAHSASNQAGFESALLVVDSRSFVEAWRELLAGPGVWPVEQVAALRERSKTLQVRARAAAVGGLAHHLGVCDECAAAEQNDGARLEECLRNIAALTWQLEQEGERSLAASAAPALVVSEHVVSEPMASESEVSDPVAPESVAPSSSDAAPEPALEAAERPPLISSPPEGWKAMDSTPQPVEAKLDENAQAAAALSELLGLAPIGSSAPARTLNPFSPVGEEPNPAQLGPDASGLPVLELHAGDDGELLEHDLTIRLERVRRAVPYPLGRGSAHVQGEGTWRLRGWAAGSTTAVPWWAAPLAVGALAGLVGLVLLLGAGSGEQPPAEANGAPGTALNATRNALLPAPRLTDDGERLQALLAQVHEHGRTESPELADLIDEEASLLAKAVTEPCIPGSVGCRLSEEARQLVKSEALPKLPSHGRTGLGDWLAELRLPEIGVKDDPRVRSIVKFHTENPVGRELFQALLFQCGAHQELLHEALTRRGMPLDLIALVMVESGCMPDAESTVGARGLWQFMPATARGYHLQVQAGVIDERLNAAKATDAALRFLGDLYRKLGSWELTLASFDLGPFGLLARLRQAGGDADYWDLVDAGRLPNEAANYVPKIEAFALILANLEHFDFKAALQKSAEASVELSVPSGTRIGLVARAAASSTTKIRELNPELMGGTAPGRSGESFSVRVPREANPRALEVLERLIAQADDADECVPYAFDWGRQRFTRAMLTRCRR